jgi:hypothetical protein
MDAKMTWIMNAIDKIARYSKEEDALFISDAYAITNLPATPVRAINVSTATNAVIADVLGQLLTDFHKRGINAGLA